MESAIIQLIIVGFVTYGLGIFTGYLLRGFIDSGIKDRSPNTMVLFAVTVVWVISMFVDILSPSYETPTLVHGLMGAIVGFFYKPFDRSKDNEK